MRDSVGARKDGCAPRRIELVGNLFRGQHEVDDSSRDCRPRHAVVARAFGILCDGHAAGGFDLAQPGRAIGRRPREHDADGSMLSVRREALKKEIDRIVLGGQSDVAPDAAGRR